MRKHSQWSVPVGRVLVIADVYSQAPCSALCYSTPVDDFARKSTKIRLHMLCQRSFRKWRKRS